MSGLQPEDVGGGSAQDGGAGSADRHVERGEASGDGGQAGGAGPLVPVEFERTGDQREKSGSGVEQAGGTGGEAGGDGGQAGGDGGQAGGAGPPVPVELERTVQDVWQVHLGCGKWQDVDPTRTEPLFQALRDGVRAIRLPRKYQKESGEYVEPAYTIDCINVTHVTQQNLSSGKRRALRAVYIIMPHGYYTFPVPPPTESPAHPADPDPEDWPWMWLSRSAASSQS